jgi:Helix-turn-helix domain
LSNASKALGSDVSSQRYDRVAQRRRAVALARHFREAEGLSIAQIAGRLGRSPATIKAYFYDPTGEKARAVKARYVGLCRGCGAYTQPRNGKGDAYAYCKACLSRGDPAPLDWWARARGDARLALPLRNAGVLLRLVGDACGAARGATR